MGTTASSDRSCSFAVDLPMQPARPPCSATDQTMKTGKHLKYAAVRIAVATCSQGDEESPC